LNQRDFAYDHFPILLFDRMEPFLPSRVGYSIFTEPCDSRVDYKRKLGGPSRIHFDLPGLDLVIEYGIWWDWDIEHLYELEAAWVYLDREGKYLMIEASWHGSYGKIEVDGEIPMREGRPLLYCQPGKHAFASRPEVFLPESVGPPCSTDAGKMGVLVTPLFEGRIEKTPERDRLVREYLRRRAFMPSLDFVKEWRMPKGAFVPWEELARWIPMRIEEILERLKGGGEP